MPDCDKIAECPFYKDRLSNLPEITKLMKYEFCHRDYTICARYLVFLAMGKEKVPQYLLPDMYSEARELLKEQHI